MPLFQITGSSSSNPRIAVQAFEFGYPADKDKVASSGVPLQPGDEILLGKVHIRFEYAET
jgi:hypothetical protein